MTTVDQVYDKLREVRHPEIKRPLVELGMIKGVTATDGKIRITLALPFRDAPVKDDLVRSLREAVAAVDASAHLDVQIAEMTQQERAAFMAASEGKSQSAQSGNRIAHVVAVLSGKGGVGKSSVAALLAVVLNRQGKRVGVLDADITGPSIPRMFGLHQSPTVLAEGVLPVQTRTGIKVMSINLLLASDDEAVIWRGPLISSAIKQFWSDVTWGDLDYLVVDLPPGTSDASLTVMQSIPLSGIVLVTSPQDLAGMVVRKAARMAQQLGAPILGLVENMSYVLCPKCGEQIEVFGASHAMHTALQLGTTLVARLPLDPAIARLCDAGRVEEYATQVIEPVAAHVVEMARGLATTGTSRGEG
jgi:Mrp family chromosome partitioning ATPase